MAGSRVCPFRASSVAVVFQEHARVTARRVKVIEKDVSRPRQFLKRFGL